MKTQQNSERNKEMKTLYKNNRKLFALVFSLILVFSILELGKAYLMGELLGLNMETKKLVSLIVVTIVFLLVYTLIDSGKQLAITRLENKIRYDLQQRCVRTILQEDPASFFRKDASTLINELTNKINEIVEKYIHSRIQMLGLVVSFISGSVYIGVLCWPILLFLYVLAGMCLLGNRFFFIPLQKRQKALLVQKEKWIQTIKNFYDNFMFIKNEHYEKTYFDLLRSGSEKLHETYNKTDSLLMASDTINNGFGQYMFLGTIGIGALFVHFQILTIPLVLAIMQVTNMVVNPLFQFATFKNRIESSRFLIEDMEQMMKEIDTRTQHETTSISQLDAISFEHLDFAYSPDHLVLKDIDLTFRRGHKYLIVGESGQGKSTLLKIMLKQISCTNVFANDMPLSSITYSSYFSHIAYVSQSFALFPLSLKENIGLGRKADIDKVLEHVGLHDLISRKEEVFESDLIALSGGQMQRIMLARALVSNKSWLVLDEAFSAVDEAIRKHLERSLLEEKEKTVIAISHKTDAITAAMYDAILLVENQTVRPISLEEYISRNE